MIKVEAVSLPEKLKTLKFLANRSPETTDDQSKDAFAKLAELGYGTIYVGHFAGKSEWERHPQGDELVMALAGGADMILLEGNIEKKIQLKAQEFVVVPKGMWHRFEVKEELKILSITPQPSDHSVERPSNER